MRDAGLPVLPNLHTLIIDGIEHIRQALWQFFLRVHTKEHARILYLAFGAHMPLSKSRFGLGKRGSDALSREPEHNL